MKKIALAVAAGLMSVSGALAGSPTPTGLVSPCSAQGSTANIAPLISPNLMAYCITDFGNSDTWFIGNPVTYAPNSDVLSGDDALSLQYRSNGGQWVSPELDAGTLNPQGVPSDWTVTAPLTCISGSVSPAPGNCSEMQSIVTDANGIQMTITSSVSGYTFTEQLSIQNTSAFDYSGFTLYDYFNFHPFGSSNHSSTAGGVTSIGTVGSSTCVITTGNPLTAGFIASGNMCGSSAPATSEIGYATPNLANNGGTPVVWQDVQAGLLLNNGNGPTPAGDTAGALGWNLGDLNAGASTSFTITKNLIPPDPAPEPGTWAMGIGAAFLLLGMNRKRRKA